MSKDESMVAAGSLLAVIKLITGWNIPTGNGLGMLQSLLASTLQKEYISLTVKEVEIAFRRHASKVQNYGKDLSLSLFNEVMEQYFGERNEAVRIESEVYLKDVEEKIKSEEEVRNQSRAVVEECFTDYKDGKFDPIKSNVSASLYDTITADSFADPAIKDDFIAKGFAAYKSALIAEKDRLRKLDAGKSDRRSEEMSYKVRINEVDAELAMLERTSQYAKRYALKFCFDWMKKNGAGFYQKEAA